MQLTETHKRVLEDFQDGEVELWSIVWEVNGGGYGPAELPGWVRTTTLRIIRDLAEAGYIEGGHMEQTQPEVWAFKPLSLSVDGLMGYIEDLWDYLGRAPNIGDGCWFQATPSGKNAIAENQ